MGQSIHEWSETPGDNATADTGVNWRENQMPSSVNNSARQMMARVAEYLSDTTPNRVSAGTADRYEIIIASQPSAWVDGLRFTFVAHQANTAAALVKVNALADKPLRTKSGQALAAGIIKGGGRYSAIYVGATDECLFDAAGDITRAAVDAAVSSAINVTAQGFGAAQSNTGGSVTAQGVNAAYNNTGGSVTAQGVSAAQSNTGNNVTAQGVSAAYNNTGGNVTAQGFGAAQSNTGDSVTAQGFNAAYNNTGGNVTAQGVSAAENNTGNNVTVQGINAARNNISNAVTAVGYGSAAGRVWSAPVGISGFVAPYSLIVSSHGFGAAGTRFCGVIGGIAPPTPAFINREYSFVVIDSNTIAFFGNQIGPITAAGTSATVAKNTLVITGSSAFGHNANPEKPDQVMLGGSNVVEVKTPGVVVPGQFTTALLPPAANHDGGIAFDTTRNILVVSQNGVWSSGAVWNGTGTPPIGTSIYLHDKSTLVMGHHLTGGHIGIGGAIGEFSFNPAGTSGNYPGTTWAVTSFCIDTGQPRINCLVTRIS
jgi:hypothetical protein